MTYLEQSEDDARDDARDEADPKPVRESHQDPGEGCNWRCEEVDGSGAESHVDVSSCQTSDYVAEEEQTGNPGS